MRDARSLARGGVLEQHVEHGSKRNEVDMAYRASQPTACENGRLTPVDFLPGPDCLTLRSATLVFACPVSTLLRQPV
jgi:hypothetical protein